MPDLAMNDNMSKETMRFVPANSPFSQECCNAHTVCSN